MINLDPVSYLSQKLRHLSLGFFVAGAIFIFLGLAIVIFPIIIQYIFVIAFVVLGITFFVMSARVAHIKDVISRFELFGGRKIDSR